MGQCVHSIGSRWADKCGAVWCEGVLLCGMKFLAHGLVDGVCAQGGAGGGVEGARIPCAKKVCSAAVACAKAFPKMPSHVDSMWVGWVFDDGFS